MDLSDLKFGLPAAEREISEGLIDYFLEYDSYLRISRGEKTIVLGNRGTGKSAIFKFLAQKQRDAGNIVIELNPEDFSYEMLRDLLADEASGFWSKNSAFAAGWKHLLYILVMKETIGNKRVYKSSQPEGKIYDYLRRTYYGYQSNPVDWLFSFLKRFEGVKIGTFEAGIKTRELSKLYKLEELEPYVNALFNLLRKRKKKAYVFIDELDRGWDSSENAKAFVSGLFQATLSMNQRSDLLTVYISLRQELYDNIPSIYDDAQKYRDVIEVIRWDETNLKSMIVKRIKYFTPSLRELDDDEAWDVVFAHQIQYRKAKSFNYIIDRTLHRPRELIQFCSDILEKNTAHIFPMDYKVINVAELKYSEERTKDIAAEYRFQYPGLLSVFEVFRGRKYSVERDELEFLALEILEGEYKVDRAAREWLDGQDHEFLIDVLWRVGFLKAYAVGGIKAYRRSGSSFVGVYQVEHLNLNTIRRFQIHPMFRAYLGMKESK